MKILFYDTQSYDRESFDRTKEQFPEIEVEYLKTGLAARTASLAKGYDAVCAFVNSDVGTKTVEALHEAGVKLILMRCAGFNNVDLKTAAKYGIDVRRVPGYSPEAVAEHAMTLAMTVNRHMHKAYTKVRENDFSLGGLMGFNFYQKTAGIVGTGKIGAAMARICRGFGMKVIAYDVYQNESLKDFVTYVTLDELLAQSDLISLHCPLMDSTYHMINRESIKKMKDGVILVNTSRGGLVKTQERAQHADPAGQTLRRPAGATRGAGRTAGHGPRIHALGAAGHPRGVDPPADAGAGRMTGCYISVKYSAGTTQ